MNTPVLHDVWAVCRQFPGKLMIDYRSADRAEAEHFLSRITDGATEVEEASPTWWRLYHWVESEPVVQP